jgi:hypothetical protein
LHALRNGRIEAELPLVSSLVVVRRAANHQQISSEAASAYILDEALRRLSMSDERIALILRQRFVDHLPVTQVAASHGYASSTIFHDQEKGWQSLARIVWQMEREVRRPESLSDAGRRSLAGLPPNTYTRLFGVDASMKALRRLLSAPPPWLVSVEGMGGVGKTSVARAVVEDLIYEEQIEHVVWLTARGHHFLWHSGRESDEPALRSAQVLEQTARALGIESISGFGEREQEQRIREAARAVPTLIVVDNLETVADVHELVQCLDRLSDPARVLLTTRQRIGAPERVATLSLRELPRPDALDFIHYHAAGQAVNTVSDATPTEIERIYAVTDGNPLAIKLVIGQANILPLDHVLTDLAAARGSSYDFYHFIFRYSWSHLSDPARRLLLHMPILDARGAAWDILASVSGVEADDPTARRALSELVNTSLLNVANDSAATCSIHRLTEYFLLSDLVHQWPVLPPP